MEVFSVQDRRGGTVFNGADTRLRAFYRRFRSKSALLKKTPLFGGVAQEIATVPIPSAGVGAVAKASNVGLGIRRRYSTGR